MGRFSKLEIGVIVAILVLIIVANRITVDAAGETAGEKATAAVNRKTAEDLRTTRVDLLKSCDRSNRRTSSLNRTIIEVEKQAEATRLVATGARKARLAAYAKMHQPEDLQAAETYLQAVRLSDSVSFELSGYANCDSQFGPRPKGQPAPRLVPSQATVDRMNAATR